MADNIASQQELDNLLSSFWAWRIKDSPEFATIIGDHSLSNLLDDRSLESFQARIDYCKATLERLASIPSEGLPADAALNYVLFQEYLGDFLEGSKYCPHFFPVNMMEGPQMDFPQVISYMSFRKKKDYEDLISRLRAFEAQIESTILLMRAGLESGRIPPRVTLTGVLEQLSELADTAIEESSFFEPFTRFPPSLSAEDGEALAAAGRRAIEEATVPALRALATFVREEYLPAAREGIAATELPEGGAFYAQCLRFHTSTALSAQQIHDLGLAEVARISQRMADTRALTGFTGSAAEFDTHLESDPRFYFTTAEALLAAYRDICKRIDPELTKLFGKLPRTPYGVVATPSHQAARAPAAYYYAPSEDGLRPGLFYANTSALHTRRSLDMEALCLHEAVPGHHLQGALAVEATDSLPAFRRLCEDRRYFESPGRFPLHTAYIEGWALYCESLGPELGLYKDPYSLYGRLSEEMWRACRLVVDTGMHALGWGREQAIDFMAGYTAMARDAIAKEVDRYITWPGQACAYKVGELRIRELRATAESALGEEFDVRAFHDTILACGPVPLNVLAQIVDQFIADSKHAAGVSADAVSSEAKAE